jgi:hypothetical protein
MRKWPSTNGPFFSERAIDSLFLHSPQAAPWCPPHLLESSYRPGNAVRLRAERADKPRALRIRNPFHDDRPARLAQLVQNRLRRSHCCLDQRTYRLRAFCGHAFRRALDRVLHRPAAPRCCSCCACCSHRFTLTGLSFVHRPDSCLSEPFAFTSCARQCVCRCACCSASSSPMSGRPTASADGCP